MVRPFGTHYLYVTKGKLEVQYTDLEGKQRKKVLASKLTPGERTKTSDFFVERQRQYERLTRKIGRGVPSNSIQILCSSSINWPEDYELDREKFHEWLDSMWEEFNAKLGGG